MKNGGISRPQLANRPSYARNEDCHLSIEPAHSNLQLIFITRKRRDATRLDMTAGQRQLDLIQAGRLSPIFFTRESKVVGFTPKSSAAPSAPLIFQSVFCRTRRRFSRSRRCISGSVK